MAAALLSLSEGEGARARRREQLRAWAEAEAEAAAAAALLPTPPPADSAPSPAPGGLPASADEAPGMGSGGRSRAVRFDAAAEFLACCAGAELEAAREMLRADSAAVNGTNADGISALHQVASVLRATNPQREPRRRRLLLLGSPLLSWPAKRLRNGHRGKSFL